MVFEWVEQVSNATQLPILIKLNVKRSMRAVGNPSRLSRPCSSASTLYSRAWLASPRNLIGEAGKRQQHGEGGVRMGMNCETAFIKGPKGTTIEMDDRWNHGPGPSTDPVTEAGRLVRTFDVGPTSGSHRLAPMIWTMSLFTTFCCDIPAPHTLSARLSAIRRGC